MNHPDWGPCRLTKALQAVTLLASKQLDNLNTANRPVFPAIPAVAPASMVTVPRDHSAMDIDFHAATTRVARSPTPSVVSFGFYRELCHQRNLCWRCLKVYDDAHRTRKLQPTLPPCPHLPVDAAKMDQFAAHCQSHPAPPPVSRSSLQTSAVATTLGSELSAGPSLPSGASSTTPALFYGGQPLYHTPPHFFHPSPFFSPLVPYPSPLPILPDPSMASASPSGPVLGPSSGPPATSVSAVSAAFS